MKPGTGLTQNKFVEEYIYTKLHRCSSLSLNLTSFVFNVSKSCTLYSLALIQLVFFFFVKYGHVACT
ncbi:hypothetical protein Hanom_Chr01g00047681 [Helianthus anomalus]